MKLWECTYKVTRSNDSFYVKDWIWSTKQPSQYSIGWYWIHSFDYLISEQQVKLAAPGVKIDKYQLSYQPFI